KGYTSHAPIYKGHGVEPEELIKTTPEDWWQDAQEGYEYLKFLGYQEIAIAGLSLGGVFTLKLAAENPLKGIIPMCTPVYFDNDTRVHIGMIPFTGFSAANFNVNTPPKESPAKGIIPM